MIYIGKFVFLHGNIIAFRHCINFNGNKVIRLIYATKTKNFC